MKARAKKGGRGGEKKSGRARCGNYTCTHARAHGSIGASGEEIAVEEAEGRHGRVHGHETRICVVILWK